MTTGAIKVITGKKKYKILLTNTMRLHSGENIRKITLLTSIVLFVSSLTQKCYCTTTQCGDSIMAVLAGWLGIAFGGAALSWFANPVLWISWISINRNFKLSFICSILSPLICLSFLFFNKVIDDEAGHYNEITGYKTGYWLWLTSSLVMIAGNLIFYASKQRAIIRS